MIQNPNPADYPHLETFVDWLYEHVEELPADVETLKARVQHWHPEERSKAMRKDVDALVANQASALRQVKATLYAGINIIEGI